MSVIGSPTRGDVTAEHIKLLLNVSIPANIAPVRIFLIQVSISVKESQYHRLSSSAARGEVLPELRACRGIPKIGLFGIHPRLATF